MSLHAVDQLETAIADVAKLAQREDGAAQNSADAIANHGNAIIDRATQEALDGLRRLRKQVDEAEKMLLDNAARLRAEVKSHVTIGSNVKAWADDISEQLACHRADHAALVGAVTVSR